MNENRHISCNASSWTIVMQRGATFSLLRKLCPGHCHILVISLFFIGIFSNHRAFSQVSDYADIGSGIHKDKILWLTWAGTDLADGIHNGDQVIYSLPLGGTLQVTFSNVSIAYPIPDPTPGDGETPDGYLPADIKTWCGATLYEAYDLSTSSSEILFSDIDAAGIVGNGENGQDINFDVTFIATINGQNIPVDVIIGDPETTNPAFSEQITVVSNAGTWELIENINGSSYGLSGLGTLTAQITDTETGTGCSGGTNSGSNSSPIIMSKGVNGINSVLNYDISYPIGDGHEGIIIGVQMPFDQGDAPLTYGGASHLQNMIALTTGGPGLQNISDLYLGAVRGDIDYHVHNPLFTANATGDDSDNSNDEDGLTAFSFMHYCSGDTLAINKTDIPLINSSGSSSTLHAWIDFDNNGTFDSDEYASSIVTNGATTPDNNLVFNVPVDAISGSTVTRFRISSDNLLNANTPSGVAIDGEVEDHEISIIIQTCPLTDVCYIIADGEAEDSLYTINPITGAHVNIGGTGTLNIEGMTIDPVVGIIYAVSNDSLGTINPVTGTFSHIYQMGNINGAEGLLDIRDVDGLTFDATNNILWASNRRGSEMDGEDDFIFQIDPATGFPITNAFGAGIDYLVIDTPEDDLDDIAMHSDGTLYAISNTGATGNQRLITINKTTGAYTTIGDYSIQDVEGLTFSASGQLLATVGSGGFNRNEFFSIDPTTAAAGFISDMSPAHDVEACACQNTNYINGIIGDRVWADLNDDGIQDIGEPGVYNVTVNLLDEFSVFIKSTTTDYNGNYNFDQLAAGNYIIEVILPVGADFVDDGQGGDPTIDSDIDQGSGESYVITLSQSQINSDIDAGLRDADVIVRTCDDIGDLLVSDVSGNLLLFDDVTGVLIDTFIRGLTNPTEMIVGPDGYLYVADHYIDQIRKYSLVTGAYLGYLNYDFASPNGLTIGPNGNLFVNNRSDDNVIEVDFSTGLVVDTFITAGSGGLDGNYGGIEFGPDGNLYVTSRYSNNVLRYNGTSGAFIDAFVASGSGGLSSPRELKFGPDGNLYVGSGDTDNILRYNGTTGAYIDEFVSAGSGGLNNPYHFEFALDGTLYVSAYGSAQEIFRFDGITGAFIDIFTSGLTAPEGFIFAPVTGCPTHDLVGRVFEDINYGGGDGRNYAVADASAIASGWSSDDIGATGARVELYNKNEDFIAFTTTDASGSYTFSSLDESDYFVRIVNTSVSSNRPTNGYGIPLIPVQTFRSDGKDDVENEVGGEDPELQDAGNGSIGIELDDLEVGSLIPQSVSNVKLEAATTSVDFGFSFDLIVNENDDQQGSLRQFIINSNELDNNNLDQEDNPTGGEAVPKDPGIETSIFMISGGGTKIITPLTELEVIRDDSLHLTGYTQSGSSPDAIINRRISVELDGNSALFNGLHIRESDIQVSGLAIHKFAKGVYSNLNSASNNFIWGNYIGMSSSGAPDAILPGNSGFGIHFEGLNNSYIGTNGDGAGDENEGNLISSNYHGINLQNTTEVLVAGNFIGTQKDGQTQLANTYIGVHVVSASTPNYIGIDDRFPSPNQLYFRNIISGNNTDGIRIVNSNNQVISGNFIGPDVTGENGLTNGNYGVQIQGTSSNTQIGTDSDGNHDLLERNVISFNSTGIRTLTSGGRGSANIIAGNYIGTDSTGLSPLGNLNNGIDINDFSSTRIGTNGDGVRDDIEGNVISSNDADGIRLSNADNTMISGNNIGLGADDSTDLGNVGRGIFITTGSQDNDIGYNTSMTSSDPDIVGNRIHYNGGTGIAVADAASLRNRISRNSLFENDGIGIDLNYDAVTPNDNGDIDAGANSLLNFPVFESIAWNTDSTLTLRGFAPAGALIEIFIADGGINPNPLPGAYTTSFGEGAVHFSDVVEGGVGDLVSSIGNYTDDGTGSVVLKTQERFHFIIDVKGTSIGVGSIITATATDAISNTSEFSGVTTVISSVCPTATQNPHVMYFRSKN